MLFFTEAATITSQAGDVVLNRGQEYKLECKATGKPKPSVMWMKNGERDPRQKVIFNPRHGSHNHGAILIGPVN